MKKLILVSALSLASLLSVPAQAESTFVNPAIAGSIATARLDFSIVIPQVLFLRVGSSSGNTATDGTINAIDFTVPGINLGDASVIAGVGGDLTAGAVTVRAYGNGGGNISLNSATTGPLKNVAGDTIPWSEINVVAGALGAPTTGFTNAAITHPAFNLGAAGGAGTATVLTATNKVVRVEGMWTYTYLNSNVVAAGTYGGINTNNGRVIYTATQL